MAAWRAVVLGVLLSVFASLAPVEAQTQRADDLAGFRTQVSQLYSQAKYAEAAPIAEQYVATARQKHGDNHTEYATAIAWLAYVYQAQGRYAEAEPLYKRSLAIDEKTLGGEHPGVAIALSSLAGLYDSQGRYAEAEPLYKRGLAIREKALGAEHLDVATNLNKLAGIYRAQGRYAEVEPLIKRSLAIREKALGAEHPAVATSLNNVAALYDDQGRYAEAESLIKRSLAIYEKALGPEHPDVATSLINLGVLYRAQGRYAEAEPLYKRGLAISEKALGAEHRAVAIALNSLAVLYRDQGRYAEAEPLYKRSLTIYEKALGGEHPDVATSLDDLAELYRTQDRYAEAEPLHKRGLAMREKALGAEHPDVARSLNHLAGLYRAQGRAAEAEPLYKRGLAIDEKALGAEHPDVGSDLNNLALLYDSQGRYAEAEPLYKRNLAIYEKTLGAEHPKLATVLNNLAVLYDSQGRYAEASSLYKRSLPIREKALGAEHPYVAQSLDNLAALALAQRDWMHAGAYWQRATKIIEGRAERGLAESERGSIKGETVRKSWYFSGLVKMTDRVTPQGHADRPRQGREMFEKAQWAQASEAASSLTQMAARGAMGNAALAILVRERQDLLAEWQVKDKQVIAAKSELSAKRKPDAEKYLSDRVTMIDARLKAIDTQFAKEFPDYASLSSPKPASVAEVQAQLRDGEALILFLDSDTRFKPTPEETFIWVVTKTDMRWVRSDLGTAALTREVAALRCGLNSAAWDVAGRCGKLLGLPPDKAPGDDDPLPFDLQRAHALYKALFGEVEDLIKGKDLLLVPSGPLTQLPFQVLVTAPAATGDHRSSAWLARSHALTVLPAVSSLKALRRVAKSSAASKPMIGFGNPLLEGNQMSMKWGDYYKQLARLARDKQRCDQPLMEHVASLRAARQGTTPSAMRGGHADLAELKMQTPLPETADELCAVGRALGADATDLLIGARASESGVKALSASGALAQYRIVHFATHGALAGQLLGTSEPGLILTPPASATDDDDGYLSASEVAALKLDADWVILSACNTAAGGADGAEAMSGLARSFFYAQARALLVSHWAVDSNATVKLITNAVTATNDPKVGRAEALRRAMLTLIDKGTDEETHPSFWAPFVVVGEGAAAK